MKPKTKIIAIVMAAFALVLIAFLFLPCFHSYCAYKKILFYNYAFENEAAVNQDFHRLGFRYKHNFAECPEKNLFMDTAEVQYFANDRNICIILYFKSDFSTTTVKSILNKKSQMKRDKVHLPDDFYSSELSEVLAWTFDDRKIYLADFGNVKKAYIEKLVEMESKEYLDYWESRRNKTIVDGDFKISYINDYNPATYNCDSQDFEIEITKNDIPIQKLYYRIPDYAFYNFSKRVIFEDYNFDGKKDIVIPLDYSGARNETYQCFFWDEIKNQFYPSDIFKSLPTPELDYERKCIYTSSSLNYSHRIYETYVFFGTDFIIKSRLHEIYTLTDLYAFSKDYGLPPNTDMVDYFKLPNPNDEGAFKAPVFIKEKWENEIRSLDLPSTEKTK